MQYQTSGGHMTVIEDSFRDMQNRLQKRADQAITEECGPVVLALSPRSEIIARYDVEVSVKLVRK
jgi:hypothetical protein